MLHAVRLANYAASVILSTGMWYVSL